AEIERAASEFGVDKRFVHQAIHQMEQAPPEPPCELATTKSPLAVGGIALTALITVYAVLTGVLISFAAGSVLPVHASDLAIFFVIGGLLGFMGKAARRSWLALVPFVVTCALGFLIVLGRNIAGNHLQNPPGFYLTVLGSVFGQMVAFAIGMGLAKIWEL